jgi:hypothetical protein
MTYPQPYGQPLVELEYRTPLWTFSRGSLGPPPQRYRGMVPIAVIFAVLFLVVVVAMVVLQVTA